MGGRWWAIILGTLLIAWFGLPAPVSAHASLVATYPQNGSLLTSPPGTLHLWFSQPVQAGTHALTVIAPSGRRVVLGPLHAGGIELWATMRATEPGTYVVIWQVTALDTHPSYGRLEFSLGHRSTVAWQSAVVTADIGAVAPLGLLLQALARWLHFAGYALGFGPLAFCALVLHPLALPETEDVEQQLWRLVQVGLLLLLLAEPLALLAQTASLGTQTLWDPTIVGDALTSNFGRVLAQRAGAAVLLWVLIGAARQGATAAPKLTLALGIGLALVDGQASHAMSSGPLWPGLAINALHVIAMGAWLGGLVSLLAIWNHHALEGRRDELVARFARLAAISLSLLAVTGALLALFHLGAPVHLADTAYGRALTLKLVLMFGAVLLALAGRRASRRHRARWWAAEAIALLSVAVLAGLLVSLPAPA